MSLRDLVSLCKRRGFIFQSSEIYGGINGFWDYGPLGTELKRNIREAWWQDMVARHNEFLVGVDAPSSFAMVGLESSIIMHPAVWRASGHYDLFHDKMIDCKESKRRYRYDHLRGRWCTHRGRRVFITIPLDSEDEGEAAEKRALKFFGVRSKNADELEWQSGILDLAAIADLTAVFAPDASELGTLTAPRDFNLMFETQTGAMEGADTTVFLRPETAQGIFTNFKNVIDSSRYRLPLGIAQIGKSFRNEITPRHFTFRSREFEQMEIEFFCHPEQSQAWYKYWRDRRMAWYLDLGLSPQRLRLREHAAAELSHYSVGTADIEYAFPFLPEGDYGELEGIAHRGDFDLRSHMEGKLDPSTRPLQVELGPDGKPRYRGSGKNLSYRDDLTGETFVPHVVEPSAGADRATLAFLADALKVDTAPDERGAPQERTRLSLHPRLAPIKAAVLPLVRKDGMPEVAKELYTALRQHLPVAYDEKDAIGRRYRRHDEIGTPYCLTIDGQTLSDRTVTIRNRDTLEQQRIRIEDCVGEIRARIG